ncbi:hypothetical protein [Niallia sp. Krafla_26]|uniref:hypothetical protein n=1 Tax=Niallia sp. Krafla_26 TaxID=3064703 RepID=UPI003D177F88
MNLQLKVVPISQNITGELLAISEDLPHFAIARFENFYEEDMTIPPKEFSSRQYPKILKMTIANLI